MAWVQIDYHNSMHMMQDSDQDTNRHVDSFVSSLGHDQIENFALPCLVSSDLISSALSLVETVPCTKIVRSEATQFTSLAMMNHRTFSSDENEVS